MIQIIEGATRALVAAQFYQMYRLRHRSRVGFFGWQLSVPLSQPEIDEFDNDDAIIILELDDVGNVTGGLRLIPTTCPNVIGTYFRHAVATEMSPVDRRIHELSHYFITDSQIGLSARQRLGRLFCAAFDYGLQRGLTHFTLICDMAFLPTLLSFRWSVIPLGLPISFEDKTCVALLIELSHIASAFTREECDLALHTASNTSH